MGYTKAEAIVLPITFIIMLMLTVGLRYWLKDASEKIKDIPFLCITVILLVGETVKQILAILNPKGYDFWSIPLHFCSTYFIWFSLAEFSKGKFRKSMQNVAFVSSLYLFVGFYVSPRSIISNACENVFASFSSAHSFFLHHFVLLYSMLTIAFKRYRPKKAEALLWIVCFTCYFSIATLFSHLLNTNYYNLLESNIPFMENFRLHAGQIPYTFIMAFITILGGAIFILITAHIREKKFKFNIL